jgi:large subunit ribosomal protein L24e
VTNCTFCGNSIEAGTGKMYIRRDSTVFQFCSSKCQRNQVTLGRVNRHVRWTKAAEEHKGERVQAVKTAAARPAKVAAKAAAKATAAKASGAKSS